MEIQNETILDHKQMFDVAIKQKNMQIFRYVGIALLLLSISALIYYFIVASKVQNATKQNYRGIFIMGYITLAVLSCVGIAAFVSPSAVATLPMLQICLWDLLWYTLLYESWSLLFKGWSNAQNIHLTNCWK